MSIAPPSREEMARLAIQGMGPLGTLPEVTNRLIALTHDAKASASDFHKVISTDPALSARVLRVVNSSLYGLPGQIASINRAVVMLGIAAVRNIALGCSFARVFQGKPLHPKFSPQGLWNHSYRVALASKVIADQIKSPLTDEAFLAGLIHDIGLVVLAQTDPYGLRETLDRVLGPDGKPVADMVSIEPSVFGTDHTLVGRVLCEHWKFPASMAAVAAGHHHPLDQGDAKILPTIVYVAERVAEKAVPVFNADLFGRRIDERALDTLGVTRAKLAIIRDWLQKEGEQTPSLVA